ncbi:hypothetical protein EUGRSUZ_E01416 [Eucalyptus grandis]|uniref:Uncharacterized protein n=2 Tax=Eucalyptus grandis TaxID=71139 RepID=A0ACC3KV60_EUCGR|nr:hypothetical protein EUGRSUZ_E01416 [Eucalyptus grandis]
MRKKRSQGRGKLVTRTAAHWPLAQEKGFSFITSQLVARSDSIRALRNQTTDDDEIERELSSVRQIPVSSPPPTMTKQQANWSPYDNNGGSCVAIAGRDYCVIAADTRMSTGYSILTRDYSKISKLADKAVLASSGFQADIKALQKHLAARHLIYQHQHNKQMSCPAMDAVTPLSELEAIDLVKTVFVSATERDIYTGDKVEIVILNAEGLRREFMDLRKD